MYYIFLNKQVIPLNFGNADESRSGARGRTHYPSSLSSSSSSLQPESSSRYSHEHTLLRAARGHSNGPPRAGRPRAVHGSFPAKHFYFPLFSVHHPGTPTCLTFARELSCPLKHARAQATGLWKLVEDARAAAAVSTAGCEEGGE